MIKSSLLGASAQHHHMMILFSSFSSSRHSMKVNEVAIHIDKGPSRELIACFFSLSLCVLIPKCEGYNRVCR